MAYAYKNAAPAIAGNKALDFGLAYNQLSQSCRVTVSAKVTVPPRNAHVFTVKKIVSVRDSLIGVTLPLKSRELGWLHRAWANGHKVAIASKAAGRGNNNVAVHNAVKFSV